MATGMGSNANDVYFAQLTEHSRNAKGYIPTFSFAKGSKKASQIRGKAWDNIAFEAEVDVYEEDLALFTSPSTSPADVTEHLGFMLSEGRRKRRFPSETFRQPNENSWKRPRTGR